MTEENENPTTVRKLVVVFDISSSTTILEELKHADQLHAWRNLLINLKSFVQDQQIVNLEIYKFLGDGWILLFPPEVNGNDLFEFLERLSSTYFSHYLSHVLPLMQTDPRPLGLTLGIDTGELIKLEMNEQVEYLGRAINVAARLQGAAKSKASRNGITNVTLFSKASFNSLLLRPKNEFPVTPTTEDLKNITGGKEFHCFEWRAQTILEIPNF